MIINGRSAVAGGGSGGLNLSVVSGTVQPALPENNTVWINSERAVGEVVLGPYCDLMNPGEGDVWINTSTRYHPNSAHGVTSVSNTMAILQQPYLLINVLQVNQWDGEQWVRCEGAIFANYAWVDMALYIFQYGTMNEAYPVGVGRASGSAVAVDCDQSPIHGNDHMVVKGLSDKVYCVAATDCGINVDGFTTLGLGCCRQEGSLSSSNLYCGFSTAAEGALSYDQACNAQSYKISPTDSMQEVLVPITCSGVVRPTVKFQSSSAAPFGLSVYYWVLS